MLATAFVRTTNEHMVASGASATVAVFNIAEAGLDAFFHDTSSTRPADGDSIRYNLPGGYAWVYAHELQRPADTIASDFIYLIESRAVLIDPNHGDSAQALRRVYQMARWQTGSIQVDAMLTAAAGIHRRSGSSQYTLEAWDGGGNNICQTGLQIASTHTGSTPPAADVEDGLPRIVSGASDSAVAAQTGIRWGDIVSGKYNADHSTVQLGDTSGFTSQLIVGDLFLNSGDRGSGLLIVTDDLYTVETGGGEVEWRGIVLVGGELQTDAALTDFHGVVVTGLNAMLGIAAPKTEFGGPGVDTDFLYEPCFVEEALKNLTGWIPVEGTRVDNWIQ